MIRSWLEFIKKGMARTIPEDHLTGRPGKIGIKTGLRNLKPFFIKYWRQGLVGAVLVIVVSLLSFPNPLITRYLIDRVILGKQLALLAGVLLLLVAVRLFSMLGGTWKQFFFTRFEQRVLLDIQQHLLDRTLRFPKSFFDSKEVGYLLSRLTADVQGLRWFFSGTLVSIASSLLSFVGGAVFLFYLKWQLALVVLGVLPALALTTRYFARKMRVLSHHGMEQQAMYTRALQESISAVPLIKAYTTEERTVRRVVDELRSSMQIGMEQATIGSAGGLTLSMIPEIASLVIMAAGSYWVITGQWSLGSLLAFQAYTGYVFGPAQFLANANIQLQSALASLERISILFEIVPEENLETGEKAERLRGEVEFKNVSFGYDNRELILQDVSFKVPAGQHVAIVGPSGVGKTTLLSLILIFYKPGRGVICFDGLPASEYQIRSLRQRIGYVSQNPLLLSGSILENLRYGNPELEEAQVVQMAKVAGIHDFIAGLPLGYQSLVGERGVNLSEGQIQRLALARALIKKPDILILDEPTSALDSVTEHSIFEALPAVVQKKTLFVVAHRFSTVVKAERVLLLNEKQLIAIGTHQELLANNPYYQSMAQNQQFGFPDKNIE